MLEIKKEELINKYENYKPYVCNNFIRRKGNSFYALIKFENNKIINEFVQDSKAFKIIKEKLLKSGYREISYKDNKYLIKSENEGYLIYKF